MNHSHDVLHLNNAPVIDFEHMLLERDMYMRVRYRPTSKAPHDNINIKNLPVLFALFQRTAPAVSHAPLSSLRGSISCLPSS